MQCVCARACVHVVNERAGLFSRHSAVSIPVCVLVVMCVARPHAAIPPTTRPLEPSPRPAARPSLWPCLADAPEPNGHPLTPARSLLPLLPPLENARLPLLDSKLLPSPLARQRALLRNPPHHLPQLGLTNLPLPQLRIAYR
eukprot:scaffold10182_cov107-Isochrysis_galbana.AAC.1